MDGQITFENPPRILAYRTDPEDGTVALPISVGARGVDVIATLLYFDPDKQRIFECANRILRHAVEGLGLLNGRHFPIPRTRIQITGQMALVEHVHFGDGVTLDDVEQAMELANSPEGVEVEKVRLTSALIDTGLLAGLVIETAQRNEFVTATESEVAAELMELTEHHYDL